MIVTAEISLYPLNDDFEKIIIPFIKKLKGHKEVDVFTNSMSTYIRGESELVFSAIHSVFLWANQQSDTISLVIKMVNRDLKVEKGFLEF